MPLGMPGKRTKEIVTLSPFVVGKYDLDGDHARTMSCFKMFSLMEYNVSILYVSFARSAHHSSGLKWTSTL